MSLERFSIDHVGQQGDGVALDGGRNIYVPYTLGGEVVDTAASPGRPADRRDLVKIITASPERIEPFCEYFGVCGGCAIQHWQTDAYRNWKRQLVVDTLKQAGIACEVGALVDAHGTGRRRATLHARQGSGELRVGFAAAGRHEIVPVGHCPILDPAMDGAIAAANAVAELLKPVAKPLDIQVSATDNGLDVDVRGSGPLGTAMLSKLSGLAKAHRLPRLTRHGELVLMQAPPRQGAEAQSRQLAASRLTHVVAVSCNPATFARDARILLGGGFKLGEVMPVDQFRHTAHVELVARYCR